MTEEQIKKLRSVKDKLREGTYNILQKPQWGEFSKDLSNCGGTFLRDIEQKRDEVRKLKISLLFFLGWRQLNKLSSEYAKKVIRKVFIRTFGCQMNDAD